METVDRRPAEGQGNGEVVRPLVQDRRASDLLQPAAVKDRNTITQGGRLVLVVRHKHHCRPKASLKQVQIAPHFQTQRSVQMCQWLIQQEHLGPPR